MTATVKPIDRLTEEAILLADLLNEKTAWRARESKLSHKEAVRIPCVEEMPKGREFLSYCIRAQT